MHIEAKASTYIHESHSIVTSATLAVRSECCIFLIYMLHPFHLFPLVVYLPPLSDYVMVLWFDVVNISN